MGNEAHIKAVITAEDRASATISRFTHGAIGGISTGLKTLATGLAVGGTAMAVFGGLSVKAFTESEDTLAQLNAVIKSTGGAAGVTAAQATDLATSLQKTTKFSDEAVLSAENLLLTFTTIGKDIFPEATKTVLDMSTALGQDTKSSAIQLGKALQDPIRGITALRRVGVNFTDAQKDVIENLVKTGRSAEAQRLILKELRVEFGGSAEAARKTFSGALAVLANNFNDLQEQIGGVLANALAPFVNQLADFVASTEFQEWMQSAIEWTARLLEKFMNFVTGVWPYVKLAWEEFVGVLKDWVIPALREAKDRLKEFNDQHPGLLLIAAGITAIGLAFAVNPIGATIMLIVAGLMVLHHYWDTVSLFLTTKWAEVTNFFQNNPLGKWVREEILRSVNSIKSDIKPIWDNLKKFWTDNKDAIVGAAMVVGAVILISITAAAAAVASLVGGLRLLMEWYNKAAPAIRATMAVFTMGGSEVVRALGASVGKRALGGGVASNTPYIVGEHGAEMFVPTGSGKVIPNAQTQSMMTGGGGSTVNIVLNAQAFMGSDVEGRKFAQTIANHLQDIAASKNTTVAGMLGAA